MNNKTLHILLGLLICLCYNPCCAQTRTSDKLKGKVRSVIFMDFKYDFKFGEPVITDTIKYTIDAYNESGYKTIRYEDGVYIKIKYNNKNKKVSEYYINNDNDTVFLEKIFYNSLGKENRVETYRFRNGKYMMISMEKTEYTNTGYIKRIYEYDGSLKTTKKKIGSKIIIEEDGKTYTDYYDKLGRLSREYIVPASHYLNPITDIKYSYDNYGNCIKEYSESEPAKKLNVNWLFVDTSIFKYKYDKYGNWVEKKEYNSDCTELKSYCKREIIYFPTNTTNKK